MRLTIANKLQLIERMTICSFCWNDDIIPNKSQGIHKVDDITMVNVKFDRLIKKLKRMDMKIVDITLYHEICKRGHEFLIEAQTSKT